MNVSEITDDRLKVLTLGREQASIEETVAFASKEQDSRAAKVEKVEYFADFSTFIKVVNGVMVEFKGVKVCAKVGDWFGYNSAYHPITQQEYEAAKPKPAPISVAGSGAARLLDVDVRDARRKHLDSLDVCLDCGSAHEGECVNTNEAKDKPPVAFAIEGVPATPGECAAFVQGVDAVLDNPQTAGEVQRPESHKSPEHIRKVLDSVLEWSIRIEERMEKLEDAVNKLREGK